jgi:hypothetical protein
MAKETLPAKAAQLRTDATDATDMTTLFPLAASVLVSLLSGLELLGVLLIGRSGCGPPV